MLHASIASVYKKALTVKDVLGVRQVGHEGLCDLAVVHGDHEGQVGELTRLGPGDEGGEDVLEGDRVLGLQGTLVHLPEEVEKLEIVRLGCNYMGSVCFGDRHV